MSWEERERVRRTADLSFMSKVNISLKRGTEGEGDLCVGGCV